MDKLDMIFELQKSFDESVQNKPPFSDWKKEDRVIALLGHVIQEAYETRNSLGLVVTGDSKWWKNAELTQEKWECVYEELIDCLHFLVSAMISAGLTSHQAFHVYEKKNVENKVRQLSDY